VNTIFQGYALFPHLSVYENVAFGLRIKRVPKAELKDRVREALQMVQLDTLGQRKPHQLSGGQQQRVAIARAVVNRPRLLLLDECLSALDAKLRLQMQMELRRLQRRLGITFIYVTHDQEEALAMSDRLLILHQGRAQQIGSPQDIYATPANLFVARFIGDINVFQATVTAIRGGHCYQIRLEDRTMEIRSLLKLQVDEPVQVLLRPEDLKLSVSPTAGAFGAEPHFPGTVEEYRYKGKTLDYLIRLDSGHLVRVCRLFDKIGLEGQCPLHQRVLIHWSPGRAHVLRDAQQDRR
jgi:spermidine/putrescine transport system ATP-binding protein